MEKEHDIIINGHKLNAEQSMAVYAALTNLEIGLKADTSGEGLTVKGHLKKLSEIFYMFQNNKKVEQILEHRKIKIIRTGLTTDNIDPDRVISQAYGEMSEVILIGRDKEEKYYFASSVADGGDILWLIEKLRLRLMDEIE